MTGTVRIFVLAMAAALAATTADAGTLQDVQKKGYIDCGVNRGLAGFALADEKGNWKGFDVDMCRAVAAAVLGDARKVKYTPLSTKERFTALQSGEVDVLARNTTWTLTRDTALGVNYAGVNYYDGQGFLVRRELGVKSAKELSGAVFCLNLGTTTELNLADYFRANKMEYRVVEYEYDENVIATYDAGKCDVMTSDRSGLAGYRLALKNPDDHIILPDVISKEPLGPVVRHGDDQWLDIVRWTLYAMLGAEELGIDSKNLDQMKESKNPAVRRILGLEGDAGQNLGIDNDWAYRIIKQVGNYAESYERNIGPETPLKLPRGLNALWKDGGLQYPMPIR